MKILSLLNINFLFFLSLLISKNSFSQDINQEFLLKKWIVNEVYFEKIYSSDSIIRSQIFEFEKNGVLKFEEDKKLYLLNWNVKSGNILELSYQDLTLIYQILYLDNTNLIYKMEVNNLSNPDKKVFLECRLIPY